MKEKLIIVIMIFSLTINVAALVTMGYFWGRDYTSRKESLEGGEPPALTAGLSLDKRQRGKMRGLRRAFLQETTPIQDTLMIKRGELANHLNAIDPDRTAINQILREINELQLQIQLAVTDNLLKEKASLDPLQQEQYGTRICNELCQGSCAMEQGAGDCRCATGREGKRGMGRGRGAGRGRWQ
jgi:Spy/CpxP family protein refolding chaperone